MVSSERGEAWMQACTDAASEGGITAQSEDRRRFLGKASAGAALAGAMWVTPSVLTLERAFACGSGPQTTFNWEGFSNGDAGTSVNDIGGVDLTITTTDPGTQGQSPNFVVQTEAGSGGKLGDQSRWWQMRQDSTRPSTAMTARFEFRRDSNDQLVELSGLCFSLLDIDLRDVENDGWRDQVWITSRTGGSVSFSVVKSSPPPGGNGPAGAGTESDRFRGRTGNIANDSTDGNVLITFTAPVDGFTVNYRNAPGPVGETGSRFIGSIMRIGIANLSWNTI